MFHGSKKILVFIILFLQNSALAQELQGPIFSLEFHKHLNINSALNPYNNWCRGNAQKDVIVSEEGIRYLGEESLGQPKLTLIDMAFIKCPDGIDTWNMGNTRLVSGGSEMALIVGDSYLLRFTAMSAEVQISDNANSIIIANVHPVYCKGGGGVCEIEMEIPVNFSHELFSK